MMYAPKRIARAAYWLAFGTSMEKRRVRQECARIAASLFGDFSIGEDYKLWRADKEFIEDYKRLSPLSPYSQERKFALREFSRLTGSMPGAIAECGCYQGASAYFLARENADVPIHLFDSFEGLSALSDQDVPVESDNMVWRKGNLRAAEDIARETLKAFKNVYIHKGWIPAVFQKAPELKYRFVHIDVDLYQPTFDSLSYFYERMSPGGIIVMDDYGFTNCRGAYIAANEFMSDKPEYILHLPTGQGVILRR